MMGFCVLLYHRVNPKFGVPPERFRRQMAFLKRWFEVTDIRKVKGKIAKPKVIITFDDGFLDTLIFAYPVLKEMGLKAMLFISPERVYGKSCLRREIDENVSTFEAFRRSFLYGDNSQFLSWEELRAISDVFDVQSHCLSHRAATGKGKPYRENSDWRIYSLTEDEREKVREGVELTSVVVKSEELARLELSQSKRIIEDRLGKEVDAVAWPWGIYTEESVKVAKDTGFRYCFTTERGFNGDDLCHIKRVAVGEGKGMFWFRTRTLFYSL